MLCEDIEDQCGAIEDLDIAAGRLLQLALLCRRELVIKDDDLGARIGLQRRQLLDFAAANQGSRIGSIEPLIEHTDNFETRRRGKSLQLGQRICETPGRRFSFDLYPDKNGGLRWRLNVVYSMRGDVLPPYLRVFRTPSACGVKPANANPRRCWGPPGRS